ncbi:MAG: DUF547 domain-containing protein [Bryobacteraceae bacterium]
MLVLPACANQAPAPVAAAPDLDAYAGVLRDYVLDNGTVRYSELRAGIAPLERFVAQIAQVSPDSHPALFPPAQARLAYWINAYNALVLWAFAKDYPRNKDRLTGAVSRGWFFYRTKFLVGGRRRTLADIEDNSIRKDFGEARIHFALVCASTSCPWLSRDAFTEANLEALLERETRRFLHQERNIRIDPDKREATLSKIFDWFRKDFGGRDHDLLEFVARYREGDREQLRQPGWKVRFFDYDWSLNDAAAT